MTTETKASLLQINGVSEDPDGGFIVKGHYSWGYPASKINGHKLNGVDSI
jgi:hypothetical protein